MLAIDDSASIFCAREMRGTERRFEGLARDAGAQPDEQMRPGVGVGDVPELALGLAAEPRGDRRRRVDLHAQRLARVEQLDQQREALAGGRRACAEELHAAVGPQLVQRRPGERERLRLGAVDELPRLADRHVWRQRLAIELLQAPASPDAVHEQRQEGDRAHDAGEGI
jgi:hypothetical protein